MKINIKFLIGQTVGTFVIFALAIFLPAGTVAWLPGWIFLGLFFAWFIALNARLFKHNPGLLQEERTLQKELTGNADYMTKVKYRIAPFFMVVKRFSE